MNTLRKLWLTVLCAAVLTSVLPAMAGPSWDDVKNKIDKNKSYSLIYDYEGPSGIFTFDYQFAPDNIKTEITKSKSDPTRKGTVIIYKGGDKVIASTGSGTIARNLDHKDVVGRPFHQSIWTMIMNQLPGKGKSEPKSTKPYKGDGSKFIWANYTIYADANGDIVKTERKDGTTPEVREFKSITWK